MLDAEGGTSGRMRSGGAASRPVTGRTVHEVPLDDSATVGEDATGGVLRVEEQATVVNDWVESTRVRVSRRIVTEVQTIEVTVRREELVFSREPILIEEARTYPRGTAPVAPEGQTVVLRREVPTVGVQVEPYERVTWQVDVVDGSAEVSLPLAAERFEVVHDPLA